MRRAGALLFQIRFFDHAESIDVRHAWRRLGIVIALGSALFGYLYSILHGAARALPPPHCRTGAVDRALRLRVLPPLSSGARGSGDRSQRAWPSRHSASTPSPPLRS